MTTTSDRSELLDALTEGISKLTTSDEWQRYLDCQSRFYHYSSNNYAEPAIMWTFADNTLWAAASGDEFST